MATFNTSYFLGLEPDLRKLVVGGRITVQEMNWLKQAVIPTAFDTPESYQLRLNKAKQILQRAGGKSANVSSSTNDQGTVVMKGPQGTFNVPKNKISLFKQNGYQQL